MRWVIILILILFFLYRPFLVEGIEKSFEITEGLIMKLGFLLLASTLSIVVGEKIG